MDNPDCLYLFDQTQRLYLTDFPERDRLMSQLFSDDELEDPEPSVYQSIVLRLLYAIIERDELSLGLLMSGLSGYPDTMIGPGYRSEFQLLGKYLQLILFSSISPQAFLALNIERDHRKVSESTAIEGIYYCAFTERYLLHITNPSLNASQVATSARSIAYGLSSVRLALTKPDYHDSRQYADHNYFHDQAGISKIILFLLSRTFILLTVLVFTLSRSTFSIAFSLLVQWCVVSFLDVFLDPMSRFILNQEIRLTHQFAQYQYRSRQDGRALFDKVKLGIALLHCLMIRYCYVSDRFTADANSRLGQLIKYIFSIVTVFTTLSFLDIKYGSLAFPLWVMPPLWVYFSVAKFRELNLFSNYFSHDSMIMLMLLQTTRDCLTQILVGAKSFIGLKALALKIRNVGNETRSSNRYLFNGLTQEEVEAGWCYLGDLVNAIDARENVHRLIAVRPLIGDCVIPIAEYTKHFEISKGDHYLSAWSPVDTHLGYHALGTLLRSSHTRISRPSDAVTDLRASEIDCHVMIHQDFLSAGIMTQRGRDFQDQEGTVHSLRVVSTEPADRASLSANTCAYHSLDYPASFFTLKRPTHIAADGSHIIYVEQTGGVIFRIGIMVTVFAFSIHYSESLIPPFLITAGLTLLLMPVLSTIESIGRSTELWLRAHGGRFGHLFGRVENVVEHVETLSGRAAHPTRIVTDMCRIM